MSDERTDAGLTPVVPSFRGPAAPPPPEEPLESLQRYKLVARLGQGGMAEVYLAAWEVAPFVHRPVVIKRLHQHFTADPRLVQMFLDEARLLTQLDHPNIVKTLEAGVIEERCCIAMEYLEGQPLHRVLRRAHHHGGLAPQIAVSVAISVLDGLHYSHELSDERGQPLEIVHRDISPQNVFVNNDGQVKVLDFGIAKAKTQEGRTATGIIKGKVGYIAPEQATGENVDRRADVWSTGVLLWEALTGARLFKADSDGATLGRSLQGEIPRPSSCRPGIPEELDRLVLRALERDVNARYGSAGAMRADLENWLARAGHSRDPRRIAALMKTLFATEIVEQHRLVSVLMARSDCTPPAPISNRIPSSSSALVLGSAAPVTSADLTRMTQQMQELGRHQRRTVRSLWASLVALAVVATSLGYCAMVKLDAVPSRRALATGVAATPPTSAVAHALPWVAAAATSFALEPLSQTSAEDTALREHTASGSAKVARPRLQRSRAVSVASVASVAISPPLTPLSAAPPRPEPTLSFGFLTLDTSPWSIVSVAGKVLGQTPLMNVKLPAGNQVLSLKNPEQGIETSYAVPIESGKTTVRRIGIE